MIHPSARAEPPARVFARAGAGVPARGSPVGTKIECASTMGKRSKTRETKPAPATNRRRGLAVLGVAGAAVALAWALWRPTSGPAAASVPVPAPQASSTPAVPQDFGVLLGEWTRPDGGYVLSVSQVAPDGKATVGYYNPRPIRVSRAEARREGGLVGLFVELNDVNYPGSTYTLRYDPASGQLKGIYFQAVERVQYEVVFVRRR
jgi:hypothetical protein